MTKKDKKLNLIFLIVALLLLTAIAVLLINTGLLIKIQNFFSGNKQYTSLKEVHYQPDQLQEIDLHDPDYSETQSLLLINDSHPLPHDFEANLAEYRESGVLMNQAMLESYGNLSDAVTAETSEKMYVSSLYRTFEEQAEIYEEDPVYALPPGFSEHQTGLAADVYVFEHAGLNFIEHPAGQFVNRQCADYGFIIRYPEGKEQITGIPFEPWHIRFVGKPHAFVIAHNYLTLEEYIENLEIGKFYQVDQYLISRQSETGSIYLPEGLSEITYSKDNTGNLIITGKK